MDDGRLYRFLRALRVDVRREEVRAAVSLFAYFFLVTFAFYIIKTFKESYQITVSPRWWWGFELGTAVLIGFVVALNTRLLNRLPRRSYSSVTLAFFAACLLFFWFVFYLIWPQTRTFPIPSLMVFAKENWGKFVFAFSFWADIFIVMSITQFWIAVNDVLYPHQAKRLVGFLVTGGLLGGIAGSLFARTLSGLVAPYELLLACPFVLLLTAIVVNLVHSEREKLRGPTEAEFHRAGRGVGYLEGLRTVRRHRYLRILAGILASAVIVGQLINFQFKFVVKAQEWSDSRRVSFLATFWFVILLLSLFFHLLTTGKVLKFFKIPLALLLAPAILLLGTVPVFFLSVVAAGPTLLGRIWGMGLRGADKVFDNTLNQSVRELLYIPIPPQIKYKAKVFIDMFVNKVALGLGAVLYWGLYQAFSFGGRSVDFIVQTLGVVALLAALVWTALVWIIHGDYRDAVSGNIELIWPPEATKEIESRININWSRRYVDLIKSRDQSLALYAQNLFKMKTKEKLTEEQKNALGLLAGELRARSMDSLLDVGGETFFPGIEEAITDKDIESTILEVLALPEYQQIMDQELGHIAGEGTASEVARMEAANLLGLMEPTPNVIHNLGRLLRDPSPDVLNYALYSAAAHQSKELVPLIIGLLGNPMIRQDAQDALAAYGPRVEDALRKHLQDREEDLEVRRAIPEVLGRAADQKAAQKAADILAAELAHGELELEQELTDSLYKIRSNRAGIRFKEKTVRAAVLSLIRRNCEAHLAADETGRLGPEQKAAIDLRTKRIFDLLALIFPYDRIVKAYQNIDQGTRKALDDSLALLDAILDRELKTVLFPLIEDLPPEERVRRLRKLAGGAA